MTNQVSPDNGHNQRPISIFERGILELERMLGDSLKAAFSGLIPLEHVEREKSTEKPAFISEHIHVPDYLNYIDTIVMPRLTKLEKRVNQTETTKGRSETLAMLDYYRRELVHDDNEVKVLFDKLFLRAAQLGPEDFRAEIGKYLHDFRRDHAVLQEQVRRSIRKSNEVTKMGVTLGRHLERTRVEAEKQAAKDHRMAVLGRYLSAAIIVTLGCAGYMVFNKYTEAGKRRQLEAENARLTREVSTLADKVQKEERQMQYLEGKLDSIQNQLCDSVYKLREEQDKSNSEIRKEYDGKIVEVKKDLRLEISIGSVKPDEGVKQNLDALSAEFDEFYLGVSNMQDQIDLSRAYSDKAIAALDEKYGTKMGLVDKRVYEMAEKLKEAQKQASSNERRLVKVEQVRNNLVNPQVLEWNEKR